MEPTEADIVQWLEMSEADFETKVLPVCARSEGSLYGVDSFIERLHAEWKEFVRRNAKALHEHVCIEFDYCNKSKDGDVRFVIGAIAGMLAVDGASVSIPVGVLIVVAIKYGWLDEFCDCETVFRTRRESLA